MQAPADDKPSAAAILASFIAYRFQDPYVHTLALEAGQALVMASAKLPQGSICFARCLSHGAPGDQPLRLAIQQFPLHPCLSTVGLAAMHHYS